MTTFKKKPEDYQILYEEFWKDIVEKDGVLNKDQVMRELSDFSKLLDAVPRVYMAVTGGRISKPLTYVEHVLSEFEERFLDKDCTQDDVRDILMSDETPEDKLEQIRDYLDIIIPS